jgi:hypothetical protein
MIILKWILVEKDVNWVNLAQDRVQWRAVVNTVMNTRVSWTLRDILIRRVSIKFSGLCSVELSGRAVYFTPRPMALKILEGRAGGGGGERGSAREVSSREVWVQSDLSLLCGTSQSRSTKWNVPVSEPRTFALQEADP